MMTENVNSQVDVQLKRIVMQKRDALHGELLDAIRETCAVHGVSVNYAEISQYADDLCEKQSAKLQESVVSTFVHALVSVAERDQVPPKKPRKSKAE